MTGDWPSVAFFTDCYHEVNGVAHTSRWLARLAVRRRRPMLVVRTGRQTQAWRSDPVSTLELSRSPLAFPVDRDLRFDPLFWRHADRVCDEVTRFGAAVVHVTSPGDVGLLGTWTAHHLGLPLVASWHTNLHEFGARRLENLLRVAPPAFRRRVGRLTHDVILRLLVRFYQIPRTLLAPNEELARMLGGHTGRPVYLMQRGVDLAQFGPAHRTRRDDGEVWLGFVGRLTPEKNVRLLAELSRAVRATGFPNAHFLVVGDGGEREWLAANLDSGHLPGVLTGSALARAYADMDLFLFPSHTDTFGNVVLEAQASGVPAVVTSAGGPKFLVADGRSGYVTHSDAEFVAVVLAHLASPERWPAMRQAAREQAAAYSWESVHDSLYAAYEAAVRRPIRPDGGRRATPPQPCRTFMASR